MRIAHISDLHLLDLEGAFPSRLMNKRFTGWVNIRLNRGHSHKPAPVHAAGRAFREAGVDHVVITGDVTNLALEREFEVVAAFLEGMGYRPEDISVVPGNHDTYTRGSHRVGRFATYLGAYATSDIHVSGPETFPFVRLRGPVAILGLSSAVPRPPLVASGELGAPQMAALRRALAHPEVASRTPVVLVHHPIHNPSSPGKVYLEGLVDADRLVDALADVPRGLLLHGHLHKRIHRQLKTRTGTIDAVGATSASLLHEHDDKMSGFNVYDVADDGAITGISALRFDPSTHGFVDTPVPKVA